MSNGTNNKAIDQIDSSRATVGIGRDDDNLWVLSTFLQARRQKYKEAGDDKRSKAAVLRAMEIDFERTYPEGTSIVVDLVTFDFVHAATRTAALKTFVARFGKTAAGWAFDVGRPMTVGGGACPS